MSVKRFALLGAAGYVAPKHMQAIKEVGGDLVAICDPHDSVGVIDRYFPGCKYFREPEIFDRHLEKLRREGKGIDYLSICTPNYLHDAHCRMAMRLDADPICEKPVVLELHNVDALHEIERETQRRVKPIMQLRHCPELQELRKSIRYRRRMQAVATYYTARGPWYDYSWKGDESKSGGLVCNIGIHVLDLLLWLFGPCVDMSRLRGDKRSDTFLIHTERADIQVVLSLEGPETQRDLAIDGEHFGLDNFGDLHTAAYREIVEGRGLFLHDVRPAIELARLLRYL